MTSYPIELNQLVVEAAGSTAKTALLYFPDHFTRDWCNMHIEFFQIVDGYTKRKALAAPRGFGKSTILGLAKAARHALYATRKFIVIVSNTKDQAIEHLNTLKAEIESNDQIEAIFGSLKGDIWREDRILLSNGVYIVAKGSGQQIRGLKRGTSRPDLILCDDLENDEMCQSEERRQKFRRWFYTDLLRSGIRSGMDCEVVVLGTILHQDALLQNLLNDDQWVSVRLEAFDDNYKSNYPEFLSDSEIDAMREDALNNGLLDELMREYRNIPVAEETKPFRTFTRYAEGDPLFIRFLRGINDRSIFTAIIVDPSRTENPTSDKSGIIAAGFDLELGSIFFHDCWKDYCDPVTLLNQAFDMADMLKTDKIFIEEDGLKLWLTTVARSVMMTRKKMYDIIPLQSRGRDKNSRIVKLVPLYRIGAILHNASTMGKLESELKDYPKAKDDHLADCGGYCVDILKDLGGFNMDDHEAYGAAGEDAPYSEIATIDDVDIQNWNII